MANENRRIVLGFQASPPLPVKLPEDVLAALRQALQAGEQRWYEVEGPDGAVLLDLKQVVYLRVESSDQKIGF